MQESGCIARVRDDECADTYGQAPGAALGWRVFCEAGSPMSGPQSREYWEAEQARFLAAYDTVASELSRIPGVVEVGIGLRRRGGRLVEEPAFVVSVREKLPASALPSGQVVPRTIQGFPTDVEVYKPPRPLLGFNDEKDKKNYGTKVGGAAISAEDHSGVGTLGCFCRQNGDNSVVLLSNHHVLLGGSAQVGSGVGQPEHEDSCCCTCNEIGKVLKGDKNLDCAIASLNADVKFYPKIRRIRRSDNTVEEEGLIKGTADPVMNQAVWKVGYKTGLTRGKISKITPRVEIAVDAAFDRFADRGDSGSVVIEKDTGNVVGLLYAIPDDSGDIGLAKKITAVQAVMNITVIPSDPTAVYDQKALEEDEDVARLFPLPAASPFEALVERLRQTPAGERLLVLFDRHRSECLALVRRRRGFTVAWRRHRGPSWIAALGRSARDPIYRVPQAIDGVARIAAAREILTALRREAGGTLAGDLDREASALVDAYGSSDTLDGMLLALEAGMAQR